jgi:hypothetical protein
MITCYNRKCSKFEIKKENYIMPSEKLKDAGETIGDPSVEIRNLLQQIGENEIPLGNSKTTEVFSGVAEDKERGTSYCVGRREYDPSGQTIQNEYAVHFGADGTVWSIDKIDGARWVKDYSRDELPMVHINAGMFLGPIIEHLRKEAN